VKFFWELNVRQFRAIGTFVEHAHILKEKKIFQGASEFCCEHITLIQPTSRLVHVADVSFWIDLLRKCSVGESAPRSCHLSKLVAAFMQNLPVDVEAFQTLTHEGMLPQIDAEAAFYLIEAERLLLAPDESSLSSLQNRCIDAILDLESQ
jgi:hypothetical protein